MDTGTLAPSSPTRAHVSEIMTAIRAMPLIGADPVLRQTRAELRPKVGYRQEPAFQKEAGHAKSPMAKTGNYLLFTSHGVILKAAARLSLAPFAVSFSAATHGGLGCLGLAGFAGLSGRSWAGRLSGRRSWPWRRARIVRTRVHVQGFLTGAVRCSRSG